ncbi:MAG: Gmad2 immunoglobulin-like domain-containing protein [Parcubacteria group bacterium]
MKQLWIILLALLIIVGGWFYFRDRSADVNDTNIATTTDNGSTKPSENTTDTSALETRTGDIIITSPLKGQVISSPLTLTGSARGGWYFEANAPVFLTDLDGKTLAQSYVMAEGEWMTTNFVPFRGTLSWTATSTGTSTQGYVVFMNDNPSGLPHLEKSVKVPVTFAN